MATRAIEDYLKAIHALSESGEAAGTSAIAERLGVAAASVTGMLKRLGELGYVDHEPYYGARLTARGRAEAVSLIRRHRVIELFLVEVLGYGWDEVHDQAERLEHAASDELVDRMAGVLGEPEVDPHGHPIPAVGAEFADQRFTSLAELEAGQPAILRRVSDEDADALRFLAELGLVPGAGLEVVGRGEEGAVRVRVGNEERVLDRALATALEVEEL